eukprot:COSAG02_NODE_40062_length_409_cov_1.422581_1_plen_35_part_10
MAGHHREGQSKQFSKEISDTIPQLEAVNTVHGISQ